MLNSSQAEDLADELARLWPVDATAWHSTSPSSRASPAGTPTVMSGERPAPKFLPWRAGTRDWLGAAFCSFWWD